MSASPLVRAVIELPAEITSDLRAHLDFMAGRKASGAVTLTLNLEGGVLQHRWHVACEERGQARGKR